MCFLLHCVEKVILVTDRDPTLWYTCALISQQEITKSLKKDLKVIKGEAKGDCSC